MRIFETNESVGVLGKRLTRAGAERLRQAFPPSHPGMRYEVERRGLFKWEVVAYQNLPACEECGQPLEGPHLGTCSKSRMQGGDARHLHSVPDRGKRVDGRG